MKNARIPELVDAINRDHRTTYTLIGKMERGVNGAYLVRCADGVQHILKLVSADDVTDQISRSARCAAAVNSPTSRTPRYEQVAFTPGFGSWYVQEFLPGTPAPWPSRPLIDQMVSLNDRQASRCVDSGINWSHRVLDSLFRDSQGWQKRIAEFGADGVALVQAVRSRVEQYADFSPTGADIVHGDFQHYNALADGENDRLTGYVDWEGAGCGDRAIDLARLLYDVFVAEAELNYTLDPGSIAMLQERIEALGGRAALTVYMAYWILQVADFGVKCGPEHAQKFFKTAYRIFDWLKI